MGKGIIKSGGTGGLYQVEVVLETSRIQAELDRLAARISQLETLIAGETDERKKRYYRLLKVSLEKKQSYLEKYRTENPTVSAWCADLTENLSGEVATAEIPGERTSIIIRPGYVGRAVYSPSRDGYLSPALALSPAETFYNLAMKPGWQKWMPTYRYGEITALEGDVCSVSLEGATNSETGLGVNQAESLSGIPIEYMSCNGAAFAIGDSVLVEFRGQDWNNPVVIGFKTDPKPCCWIYQMWDEEPGIWYWHPDFSPPIDALYSVSGGELHVETDRDGESMVLYIEYFAGSDIPPEAILRFSNSGYATVSDTDCRAYALVRLSDRADGHTERDYDLYTIVDRQYTWIPGYSEYVGPGEKEITLSDVLPDENFQVTHIGMVFMTHVPSEEETAHLKVDMDYITLCPS